MMEFKELEIKSELGWFRRIIQSKQIRKTAIFIVIGAVAGFLFYYFSQGRHLDTLVSGEVFKSLLIGGFFGFFITNSPCARNRC